MGLMFFLHISNPVSKNVRQYLKTRLKIYLYKWRYMYFRAKCFKAQCNSITRL